ncbi:MAG: baseplate J/gp47 family protein [Bradymonadaceae bacterium]
MPLTPDGYDAKRGSDWLEQIRSEYESRTGLSIDFERDEFVAQITAIMAERLADLSQAAQSLYDTFDPQQAEGVYLDVLAGLVGITRQEATASVVQMTLVNSDGSQITVPSGSEVEDPQNRIWVAAEDINIAGNSSETGMFRARQDGPLQLQANQLDTRTSPPQGRIVTPVSGWSEVYNHQDASPGRARETDAELRRRRQESLQVVGAAAIPAIEARLQEDVDKVTAAAVVDNYNLQSKTLSTGQTLPPKSVTAFIYPNDSNVANPSEYRTAIAEMLADTVPAGIESAGGQTEQVTLADGYDKPFGWYWVAEQTVDTNVDVTLEPGYSLTSSLKSEIKDEVNAYFAQIAVGADVVKLPILGRLSTLEALQSATLNFDSGGNTGLDRVDIARDKIAVSGTVTVS